MRLNEKMSCSYSVACQLVIVISCSYFNTFSRIKCFSAPGMNVMCVAGSPHSATHQGVAHPGRLCVQDIWSWEEARKSDPVHHVPLAHCFLHLHAALLFSG